MKTFLSIIAFLFLFNLTSQGIVVGVNGGGGGSYTEICGYNYLTIYVEPIYYNPAYTYKWYMINQTCSGVGSGTNIEIPGTFANGTTLIQVNETNLYFVVAYDSNNQPVDSSYPITVLSPDNNGGICASTTSLCSGQTVRLKTLMETEWSTGLGVSGTISLQWQKDGTDIPGANDIEYIPTQPGLYRLRFNTYCGSGYSNDILVNYGSGMNVAISGPTGICSGNTGYLYATQGFSSYLWSTGSTATSISVTSAGTYTVTVTNDFGCTASATKQVSVDLPANPVLSPSGSQIVCSGNSINLTVTPPPAGSNTTTRWFKDGTLISGANSLSYTATTSGVYRVQQFNGCGTFTAQDVSYVTFASSTLSVSAAATGSTSVCHSSGSVNILATVTGTAQTYQWRLNGNNISGANSSLYNATSSGDYDVVVSNPCTSSVSNSISVSIESSAPSISGGISGPSKVCKNEQGVAYSISPIANATSYTWTVPANATIASGQGTNSIVVNFGSTIDDIIVHASNVCGNGLPKAKKVNENRRCRIINPGVENLPETFELSVYPNPSTEVLNILFNLNEGDPYQIFMTDISGKVVQNLEGISAGSYEQLSIDISGFTSGVYLLKFISRNETMVKRISVQIQ